MDLLRTLPALALLGVPSATPVEQSATYLVSIAVPIGSGDLLEEFTIETWGLDILAICSIPRGWYVRAGRSAAPDGVIEGEATHGVTRLNSGRSSELRDIALVRMWGPLQGGSRRFGSGEEIASFLGEARLTDSRGRLRQTPLTLESIRLTPATRCPAR